MPARSIKFPDDRSMGTLYLRSLENDGGWNEYAEAQGEVVIPSGMDVSLWVSNKAASDLTPLSILAADDLQGLGIFCLKLDESQLQHIRHLTGLLELALWETDIRDIAFSYLSRLINLRRLDIGDTQVTDEGLAFVWGLSMLEELHLPDTQIGNQGLRYIENLGKLKRLNLVGTRVNDEGFDSLKKLTNLKLLSIIDTDISYPVFARLKRELPDCQIKYHEFAR
jgi:hypothetical protein